MKKKSPQYHFLLIGFRVEEQWPEFLRDAVHSWGTLDCIQEEQAITAIKSKDYQLVIIDSGVVLNAAPLVSNLCTQRAKLPILVVTASSTWQSAREVLKAGAVDYVSRSFDKDELRSLVKKILRQSGMTPAVVGQESHPIQAATANILFADNTSTFLKTRSEFLEAEGYHIIPATSLTEAREILKKGGVDLAILDIRLEDDDDEKDISGLTLASEVDESLPKIILTAYPSIDFVRDTYISIHGAEFLDKLEGAEALNAAVRRILDKN